MNAPDLIIVGSGPSGAQAAKQAIEDGLTVTMLDFGNDNDLQNNVPNASFSDLRRLDDGQRSYFLGDGFGGESSRNDRLGAHFTAPRQFIVQDVDNLLPVRSETFFPVQSLALGGLGAGWGAGAPTFEDFELERAGMPAKALWHHYDQVAHDIGISGALHDDTADQVLRIRHVQPAAEIDSNATSILQSYEAHRPAVNAAGFRLGRAPLAMLTQPLSRDGFVRGSNPYNDMDFYGMSNRSVYRPKYTIEELRAHPRFTYIGGALVQRFEESSEGVDVTYTTACGDQARARAKKLLLAAGAVNSARIVLRSLGLFGVRLPLLCNVMHYIVAVNLRMVGRAAGDRRHSLAQLLGLYTPQHRAPEHVMAAIYSYRALMHYRIVKDIPLPPALGLLVSRALMTSLTLVGVHHPERHGTSKWIELQKRVSGDEIHAHYELGTDERELIRRDIKGLTECLRRIRCFSLAVFGTEPGSSIHYAGTIPRSTHASESPLTSDERGKLHGSRHVFLGDSATWSYLPAKGLTLTLMANARRVAAEAGKEILHCRTA